MACGLCEAKKTLDNVRFIGRNIFVIICKICNEPMAVSIFHRSHFRGKEKDEIRFAFYIALRLKGKLDWTKHNEYRGHAHIHLKQEAL